MDNVCFSHRPVHRATPERVPPQASPVPRRPLHVLVGLALALATFLIWVSFAQPSPAEPLATRSAATGRYQPPVVGPLVVLRPFEGPRTRFGAGHRGVDLASDSGQVIAPAEGTVAFAGTVVDRGVVVLRHRDGVLTEYEPVAPLVSAGSTVSAGQPIGTVRGPHAGCPGQCVHWGARRNGLYFDPLLLLRRLGVVRLLPDHPG